MYIIDPEGTAIINTECTFCLTVENDFLDGEDGIKKRWCIKASNRGINILLDVYATGDAAREDLDSIYRALANGERVFDMRNKKN